MVEEPRGTIRGSGVPGFPPHAKTITLLKVPFPEKSAFNTHICALQVSIKLWTERSYEGIIFSVLRSVIRLPDHILSTYFVS